ncbi:MAG: PaaI family thioesterase [Crocinitomicaceae bacterium]|nr:PaaI family thioesterase [Crocinitomicaceae bacterium]MDG1776825.1 PaaI family thioesterase [Crocinitomicaceae bacterium]
MNSFIDNPLIQGYIKSNNFGQLLGMNFKILNPGEIVYMMSVTKSHLATPMAAHGGSISALMDAAMGVCALSQVISDNRVVSTIELKISFIAPGFLGDKLTASTSIVKAGKRLLFVEGEIVNQEGKLIASATGTFNSYPAEKAGFD